MEQPLVTAITHSTGEARVTLTALPNEPGIAGRIMSALAGGGVNVDLIIQNEPRDGAGAGMSFTVPREQLDAARDVLDPLRLELSFGEVQGDPRMGRVSLIGAGLKTNPTVATTAFTELGEAGVNIEMISTSPIEISCVIAEGDVPRAVERLRAAFGLESGEVREQDTTGDHRPVTVPAEGS
jgi:aspartate kinase